MGVIEIKLKAVGEYKPKRYVGWVTLSDHNNVRFYYCGELLGFLPFKEAAVQWLGTWGIKRAMKHMKTYFNSKDKRAFILSTTALTKREENPALYSEYVAWERANIRRVVRSTIVKRLRKRKNVRVNKDNVITNNKVGCKSCLCFSCVSSNAFYSKDQCKNCIMCQSNGFDWPKCRTQCDKYKKGNPNDGGWCDDKDRLTYARQLC